MWYLPYTRRMPIGSLNRDCIQYQVLLVTSQGDTLVVQNVHHVRQSKRRQQLMCALMCVLDRHMGIFLLNFRTVNICEGTRAASSCTPCTLRLK